MTRIAVGLRAQHRTPSQFQTLEEINPLQTTLFRTGYCKHESRLALRSAEIRPLFRRFVKCIELKTLDSFYTSLTPPHSTDTPVEPPQGRFSASRPQSTSAEPKPSERIESITTAHRTLPSSSHPVAVALLDFGRAALPSPCLHTAGPGQVVPSDQTTKSIITNNEHLPSL